MGTEIHDRSLLPDPSETPTVLTTGMITVLKGLKPIKEKLRTSLMSPGARKKIREQAYLRK